MLRTSDQLYRADWTLQDYIDVADFERENTRQVKVSPRERWAYLNGQRSHHPEKLVADIGTVVFGDSHGLATFEIKRSLK